MGAAGPITAPGGLDALKDGASSRQSHKPSSRLPLVPETKLQEVVVPKIGVAESRSRKGEDEQSKIEEGSRELASEGVQRLGYYCDWHQVRAG